jgi:hypothetical protein
MRSASVARNAVHGLEVWAPGAASPTTLRIAYAQHLPDGHKVRASRPGFPCNLTDV